MTTDAALELEVEGTLDALERANDAVESFLESRDVGLRVALAARLVVEELGTNAIKYGGPDGAPAPGLRLRVELTDELVVLTLSDAGHPFDPTAQAPAGAPTSLDDATVGGLGLTMVRNAAHRFVYERLDDRNVTRVELLRPAAGLAPSAS